MYYVVNYHINISFLNWHQMDSDDIMDDLV